MRVTRPQHNINMNHKEFLSLHKMKSSQEVYRFDKQTILTSLSDSVGTPQTLKCKHDVKCSEFV